MWDQCWSTARIHLSLSDDDFYQLTPRQLRLLMARHRERTEHRELLAGIIAATVGNHSFSPPKKPLTPGLFMPSQWRERAARQNKPRLNRRAIAQNVRCFLVARVETESSDAR